MKVLLTSLYYYPKIGGVENSLRYIAKELKDQGHDVRIMSFDSSVLKRQVDNVDGLDVYRYFVLSSRNPLIYHLRIKKAAVESFEDLLKDFVPDQIWTRNTIIASGLIKSKKVKIIKHIFSTTSLLNVEGLYSNIRRLPFLKNILASGLKIIDQYSLTKIDSKVVSSGKVISITFSNMMKRQLQEEVRGEAPPIEVIYPGIDFEVFHYESSINKFANLIRAYPVLNDDFILYVGRLAPAKNLEILINALAQLSSIKLVIVGEGTDEYCTYLKDQCLRGGVQDRVFFVGKQSEALPFIYSRARVTVLPTKIETFGQVLIESLACGTPIIGFGNNLIFKTAVNEIVTHHYNGVIVDKYSSEQLSQAIETVLKRLGKESEIRKYNIAYVTEKYNWGNTVNKILSL